MGHRPCANLATVTSLLCTVMTSMHLVFELLSLHVFWPMWTVL